MKGEAQKCRLRTSNRIIISRTAEVPLAEEGLVSDTMWREELMEGRSLVESRMPPLSLVEVALEVVYQEKINNFAAEGTLTARPSF